MTASSVSIIVDCMGGDRGPSIPVQAAVKALESQPQLRITLVGVKTILEPLIAPHLERYGDRLQWIHAPDVITMNDSVSVALRSKKESSMKLGLELVASGEASAMVSSGNTGALMALARYVLKMLPGVDRPAIIAPLPSKGGRTFVLDLGANVNSDSETLFQFGVMGSLYCRVAHGMPAPKVALLNIGEESIKGNDQIKRAALLLQENTQINYQGFVEGHQIYQGCADVVVCDGFVGNTLLKASEGLSDYLYAELVAEYQRSWFHKVLFQLSSPVFTRLRKKSDPEYLNGASFVGINGSVVKSHGNASAGAFYHAILSAVSEANNNLPEKIKHELEKVLIDGM